MRRRIKRWYDRHMPEDLRPLPTWYWIWAIFSPFFLALINMKFHGIVGGLVWVGMVVLAAVVVNWQIGSPKEIKDRGR